MDNQDNSQDPSQTNPGLWEYVKQKLADAGNSVQNQYNQGQQNLQQAGTFGPNHTLSQAQLGALTNMGMQGAMSTIGSVADAAPVAGAAEDAGWSASQPPAQDVMKNGGATDAGANSSPYNMDQIRMAMQKYNRGLK